MATDTKSKSSAAPKPSGPKPESGRGARKAAESVTFLAIAATVLVLANVVGYFWFGRVDLTENEIFSLADGSERLASELEDDLKITVFYTSDAPSAWAAHQRYVRDIVQEYASAGSRVKLRWVDPDDEDEKTEARDAGATERILSGGSTTSATLVRGFAALVLEYQGEREVLEFPVPSTEGLEYEISTRIRQLAYDPLPIGIVSGHGSPTLEQGLSTLASALPNYELRPVDLSEEVDHELRALLIVDPTEAFTEPELRRINQFVMRGGSLGVFGGGLNLSLQGGQMGMGPSASPATTELNDLLEGWGITIGTGMVADARSIQIPMRTQMGFPIPVRFPPVPTVRFDDDAQTHPVTFRVPYAPFFFSSPVRVSDRFHELDGQVLGRTSEEASWLLTESSISLAPRDPSEWQSTVGEARGPFPVIVALSGELPTAFPEAAASTPDAPAERIEAPAVAAATVRVLVVGTGTMLRDEFLPRGGEGAQQLTEGLVVALNGIDWLSQDSDLIAVRAKSIDEPLIETPEAMAVTEAAQDEQTAAAEGDAEGAEAARERHEQANEAWNNKKLWGYQVPLSAGLPLLVAAFGLLRWWMRANKRANLQELRKKLTAAKGSSTRGGSRDSAR